jgi:hypothetical protein
VKPHVFPNPIIIDCPCSFVHHIFDNRFSFNGFKPYPFKFHFITKVERIAKQPWTIVTFMKRSLVFYKPIILQLHATICHLWPFSITINHPWIFCDYPIICYNYYYIYLKFHHPMWMTFKYIIHEYTISSH